MPRISGRDRRISLPPSFQPGEPDMSVCDAGPAEGSFQVFVSSLVEDPQNAASSSGLFTTFTRQPIVRIKMKKFGKLAWANIAHLGGLHVHLRGGLK